MNVKFDDYGDRKSYSRQLQIPELSYLKREIGGDFPNYAKQMQTSFVHDAQIVAPFSNFVFLQFISLGE